MPTAHRKIGGTCKHALTMREKATPGIAEHGPLKALEAKSAQEGLVLTEAQLVALEKAKTEKEAHGEFESEHPGYCGAQDTFYVGSEGGRARLPADVHRHLRQGCLRQAL